MDEQDRLTELELRYMTMAELLDQLNEALTEANARETLLERRVARLEQALQDVLHSVDRPAVEKPPHY